MGIQITETQAREELAKVRQLYDDGAKVNNTFNAIIYGDKGTGKSRLSTTCRFPVLFHSFDQGGTKTREIKKQIEAGNIIADTRYETEDSKKPTAFALWEKEFHRLRHSGFFNHIGTFFLDSITTWSDAILNRITALQGRAGQSPQLQDYMVQQQTMKDILKIFTMLPCDCILTGHMGYDKDEMTGALHSSLLLGPKAAVKMPILFDEMYVTIAKAKARDVDYSLLTANTGFYKASTRIGGGIFDTYETPDIKYLLKKAGMSTEDVMKM